MCVLLIFVHRLRKIAREKGESEPLKKKGQRLMIKFLVFWAKVKGCGALKYLGGREHRLK